MKKTVWLLLDNRMGSAGQIRGVAQALDEDMFEIVEKKIVYNRFSFLPNWIRGVSLIGVEGNSAKQLKAPFPDLAISASRRTAPIARYIKRKSKGKTKIVQMLHPGRSSGLEDFDLMFLPEHDGEKKLTNNTILTKGSPHRITDKTLQEARLKFEGNFQNLSRPLTALIVGGGLNGKKFSSDNAKKLVDDVLELKRKISGDILLTTSSRTGVEAQNIIVKRLKDSKISSYNFFWGDKSDNPYIGFLACSDNIVVTGESVSMCCEACGTGKPVYIFSGSKWLRPKHYRFIKSLFAGKFATPLNVENVGFKPENRLNVAMDIALKIKELF